MNIEIDGLPDNLEPGRYLITASPAPRHAGSFRFTWLGPDTSPPEPEPAPDPAPFDEAVLAAIAPQLDRLATLIGVLLDNGVIDAGELSATMPIRSPRRWLATGDAS